MAGSLNRRVGMRTVLPHEAISWTATHYLPGLDHELIRCNVMTQIPNGDGMAVPIEQGVFGVMVSSAIGGLFKSQIIDYWLGGMAREDPSIDIRHLVESGGDEIGNAVRAMARKKRESQDESGGDDELPPAAPTAVTPVTPETPFRRS
jgi:hypothetical protein